MVFTSFTSDAMWEHLPYGFKNIFVKSHYTTESAKRTRWQIYNGVLKMSQKLELNSLHNGQRSRKAPSN